MVLESALHGKAASIEFDAQAGLIQFDMYLVALCDLELVVVAIELVDNLTDNRVEYGSL